MQCARRVWLVLIFLCMSECIVSRLYSQSEATRPAFSEHFIVEKPFETQMLELTNQYRIGKELENLVWDESLAELARAHSREMAIQGYISHDLPSGNVTSRMVRAGYFHNAARENVARSGSISWAQDALLKSPMHEKNIAANDVTMIGIGIVRAPEPYSRMLYITEIFATPRSVHPAEAVHSELLARINKLRQKGAGALASDPMLEQLASESLSSLAYPYERQELRDILATSKQKLQEDGRTDLSRVSVIMQLVRDPLSLKIPAPISEKAATVYGSAIRKVLDETNQPAFLVMTLVGFTNQPALTMIASR
jgi:uncharacterized protein YkwD